MIPLYHGLPGMSTTFVSHITLVLLCHYCAITVGYCELLYPGGMGISVAI